MQAYVEKLTGKVKKFYGTQMEALKTETGHEYQLGLYWQSIDDFVEELCYAMSTKSLTIGNVRDAMNWLSSMWNFCH